MPSTRATAGRVAAAGVAAVALAAIIGAVAFGASQQPSSGPTPTASPTSTPAPTAPATPIPATPDPTPAPTATPVGVPPVIVLDTINDQDPRLVIDDQMGRLVTARSGHAGDGMSVRWNSARVDQVDPTTIQVTWSKVTVWKTQFDPSRYGAPTAASRAIPWSQIEPPSRRT